MSKEYKNIDELYRAELSGTTTQVPASVKAGIDKELGFNSRRYWLYILPLAAIIVGSIIFIPDWSGESDNELVSTDSKNLTTSSNENNSADESNSLVDATEQEEDAIQKDASSAQREDANSKSPVHPFTGEVLQKEDIQKSIDQSSGTNSRERNDSKKEEKKKVTHTVVTYQPSNNEEDSKVSNNKKESSVKEKDGEIKKEETSSNKDKKGDIAEEQTEDKDQDKLEENVEMKSEIKQETKIDEKTKEAEKSVTSNNEDVTKEENIEKSEENKASDEKNEIVENEEKVETDLAKKEEEFDDSDESSDGVTIEKPKEKKKQWLVTLEGGPNIARSFYDATSVPEQDLYSASMSDNLGSEISLAANYRTNKAFMLGSGLNYSSFKETYDFVDEYWLQDSTETLTIIYDSLSFPIDTVSTWTYDSTFVSNFNHNGFNKVSYLSLPINMGVQIPWKKFRFDILASLRFNVLMGASGLHYDNNIFTPFTGSSNNPYKRFYVDAVFAGNIHYQIVEHLFLTASIRYKPVFGNTYNVTGINRRFHYTHLGLGLTLEL